MRLIDKESIKGKIIYSLGVGVGILIALSNKKHSYELTESLVKEIFGFKTKENLIKRDLYRLRKQKIIKFEKSRDNYKIVLTDEGKKIYLRFNYEKMRLNKKQVWDMKWRMILFDIPNKKKWARDAFSYRMKELGCVRFNNSVWVYPYPCEKEINFLASYWGVEKFVHFAIVSKITNEEILKKHFKI